jgi:hypothetical protein
MAKFLELRSGDGKNVLWVNMDNVRFMQDSTPPRSNFTTLKFDENHSITVQGPASVIAAKSGG